MRLWPLKTMRLNLKINNEFRNIWLENLNPLVRKTYPLFAPTRGVLSKQPFTHPPFYQISKAAITI